MQSVRCAWRAARLAVVCAAFGCGGTQSEGGTTSVEASRAQRGDRTLTIVEALPELEATGRCGAFDELGELVTQPLLAGRLTMRSPHDAVSSALPHDIMSAPTSDARETRLVVERGSSRMVVFVKETFSTPGGRFEENVLHVMSPLIRQGTIARVRLSSGLDALIVEASSVDGPPGGVVIAEAWIVNVEGTVARVGVFVTPDIADAPSGCRALARRLFESVAPGDARLGLEGGRRAVGPFELELPAGIAVYSDEGPDFEVYHLVPVRDFELPASQLGLYLGHHPTFEPSGVERAGELLGRGVSWWVSDHDGESLRESLIERATDGPYLHVFIEAATADEAEALVQVATRLRER